MTFRHGYFTGRSYTFGAYAESSPERLSLVCLLRSHRPPSLDKSFSLLELGCGQGYHLCLQAANYPQARFVGIDFHPDHVAHARSLAVATGLANIEFLQADFLELEQKPLELRDVFDVVVAHGVLGWVSPAVGSALLRLAEACLRPGGLFYLSYNSMPGWLAALPFQHAITSLQAQCGHGLPAFEAAKTLFEGLRDAGGKLFEAQPGLGPRLEGLRSLDPSYLLHEYNHSQWQPLYADTVIQRAQDLGLSFIGSASLAENFDGLLPDLFRQQMQQQQDPSMQELVRDILTNQSFRRDLYVKGRDPLWPREALSALEGLQLLRLADRAA